MEWGEPQLPGLVDKGTALVSNYKNEAQIPRPDDLQRLSGQPFQSLKHLAKDKTWLGDEKNGQRILDLLVKIEKKNFSLPERS